MVGVFFAEGCYQGRNVLRNKHGLHLQGRNGFPKCFEGGEQTRSNWY